ncbi:protein of unknown function [Candidatus Nitrosocosmicus franklandus]|uniref:Uncharacterized protein n=1 Tax=Candidatus Nitrosocosmicus franklandianus TaxID=1798806 RepID=A0A484IBP6_9ARCH|nr:protein of unknown function [Candidatus Nitrosocosmicus franklandus]
MTFIRYNTNLLVMAINKNKNLHIIAFTHLNNLRASISGKAILKLTLKSILSFLK